MVLAADMYCPLSLGWKWVQSTNCYPDKWKTTNRHVRNRKKMEWYLNEIFCRRESLVETWKFFAFAIRREIYWVQIIQVLQIFKTPTISCLFLVIHLIFKNRQCSISPDYYSLCKTNNLCSHSFWWSLDGQKNIFTRLYNNTQYLISHPYFVNPVSS